jgi:glutathione peroxidase-family protein
MKFFILIVLLASVNTLGGNFYSLSFTRLDGTTIPTTKFQGKKVIIYVFNGGHPNRGTLLAMDSIQRANVDSVVVLAFPALDFDSSAKSASLKVLSDSLGLSMVMAQPCRVKRAAAGAQQPLFRWLTTASANTRFGRDVEDDGMLFVISKQGSLYGVINGGLYSAVLPQVLKYNYQN